MANILKLVLLLALGTICSCQYKNITILNITDVSPNKQNFTISSDTLMASVQPVKPLANGPVSFTLNGTFLQETHKTGIFVTITDLIAEKVYYQNQFFSGEKNYTKDENFTHTIKWLMPQYITASEYEAHISLRDWFNQSIVFGEVLVSMVV